VGSKADCIPTAIMPWLYSDKNYYSRNTVPKLDRSVLEKYLQLNQQAISFHLALLLTTYNSQSQNTSNNMKNQALIAHTPRDSRPDPNNMLIWSELLS
jgi:hypothetical protein